MRIPALICLLALPAMAQSAFGPVSEGWTAKLGNGRAMLLLVDVNPGWANRMLDPALEDIAFELTFENIPSSDPTAQRMGFAGPAAYLLNEAGSVLGSWRSGPPQDVRAAFAEVSWRTRAENLKAALRTHPERMDLRWALVAEYWQRVPRRFSLKDLEALSDALEGLFRTGAWAASEAPRLPAFAPPKRMNSEAPAFGNALTELARTRLADVRETLAKDPGNTTAWMLAALLTAWHPETEPRLWTFFRDQEPGPGPFEALIEWPSPSALQAPEALKPLLAGMLALRKEMGLEAQPILLKLAPDLAPEDLDATVDAAAASGIDGLIATNTTLDRGIVSEANRARVERWGAGGLSGRGLHPKARDVRKRVLARLAGRLPLVACGGISTGAEAAEALADGAALAQLYTALIFEGPGLVGRINKELAGA